MRKTMLNLLRCPFCGTRLSILENNALVHTNACLESGVLGCECCTFPIVAGIPVMNASDTTRKALNALEAGRHEEALLTLLELDEETGNRFRTLLQRGTHTTYRDALAILSLDAESTYFLYRFSDPTYLTTEALLQSLSQDQRTLSGSVLDLCGGSGHLTRVISGLRFPNDTMFPSAVLADVSFWKLWLATRFTSPECEPVCCDANQPLPFRRDSFSMVLLSDAFPYIWNKRLLAEEMMRLAGKDGVIVMSHLHSALGENFSTGDTLTPEAYRNLFATHDPRLFSDERLFTDLFDHRIVNLTCHVLPEDLRREPSLTIVASKHASLFRSYKVPDTIEITGELKVNPLYRVERHGGSSVLTLTFPTPEYAMEFDTCKRYLPCSVTVNADLTGSINPMIFGGNYENFRHRRVILDVPPRYC